MAAEPCADRPIQCASGLRARGPGESGRCRRPRRPAGWVAWCWGSCCAGRSEEHTSELQSLMRISYAVFCLKKKKKTCKHTIPFEVKNLKTEITTLRPLHDLASHRTGVIY